MVEQTSSIRTLDAIPPKDTRAILSLRLLIARAANTDSLAWWEDESLASHASFLLERLFPRSPLLAARSLALRAALARHQAACDQYEGALHLYRLDADNRDRLALRSESLLEIPVPDDPITTMNALRQYLLSVIGKPQPYTVLRRMNARVLQIDIPRQPSGVSPFLHRARTLAWAYMEGDRKQPVFPFFLEQKD